MVKTKLKKQVKQLVGGGKLIGQGSYGSVYVYNRSQVIKISHFHENEEAKQDTYRREVYFLELLKDTGIVPALKSSFEQGQIGVQIMERFDGCMKDLGSTQALHKKLLVRSLLFTEKQFQVMCSLAKKLDFMGIHHGDFKLRNLLYQNEGHKIKVSDFGFAGSSTTPYSPLIGFVRHYGCPATKLKVGDSFQLVSPIPDSVLPFANRMHLYMYFVRSMDRFFILQPTLSVTALARSDLLTFLQLSLDQENEIYKYCPHLLKVKKKRKIT